MAATTESINEPPMQAYIGTKIIKAAPMTPGDYDELMSKPYAPSPHGNDEGYLVKYEDGYQSWSSKAVFEAAYRLTSGMPFGLAVEAMKKGLSVARNGWIGHICITTSGLAFIHVDRDVDAWHPYDEDLLADDWQVVE